jgi:RNA polymerase sigma factor (sigma-70 family)
MNTTPNTLSDNEVIEMLLDHSRERAAILYLYKQYCEPLSWFVKQNSGSQQDGQDVFQEVVVSFIHLVKQGKFRGESSIKTLLYTMNRNIWFNELKRRGRSNERDKHFEQAREGNTGSDEGTLENREARQQLFEVIAALGESCKKLLLLFYYENLPMKKILLTTNFENEQVLRNKKYKCIKKLEEMINQKTGLLQQLKMLFHG